MPTPGRRLVGFAHRWEDLGAGEDILSWISSGYDIPLDPDEPLLFSYPSKQNLTCIDAF